MTLKSGFVPRDDENTVFMYVGHLAEIEKKKKEETVRTGKFISLLIRQQPLRVFG